MYKLVEFIDEKEYIHAFLTFPSIVYTGDKNYRPQRKSEVVSWLNGKQPGARFLKQKNILVFRHPNMVAARGIVFVNEIGKFGSIGFFECLKDADAVKILVEASKSFCKAFGVKEIYTPMNGSIWSNYRVMTKGFDDMPFLGEPYNKFYYHQILSECGFKTVKTWETQFADKTHAMGKYASRYQEIERKQHLKGYQVRSMNDFEEDIRIIHKLVMNSFAEFFLFHELEEEDFVKMYGDLKLICDKKTIKIAFNSKGEPIGFGIALPDYQSKLGFLFRYAKRYTFLYMGTLQKNGVSVYPLCVKSIVAPILKRLFCKNKGVICAMMSEEAKTRSFAKEYEHVHEYALLRLEEM